ncbi:malto-oligosyltrehalose trehalohydrolase [Paraburkholderia bonniea]|uniref:malto-oligosyltrehalose trehalohydrolase n=1 Tax=Paraburkholderia bonniea TaxID=2152891 RepID=UPI002573DFFB|nr:malto-oligosyltrehalose trehalohydrolase [Paraburkholderia bonniea]WJF91703.1 malto-oligosyltrehalose trehalohydrolase [Paraburkholderia bonniea]WJF95023.1 malto-oligosyltrehalose trehalohydrolase [Paraburkholderia bonniea]
MFECPIDHHAQHYAHCLPFGAQLIGAASAAPRTRFRFWAPSCKTVQLEIEQGPARTALLDMHPSGGGWFEGEAHCGAGTLYRYRLDGALAVPDPASRFQPRDTHGPSEVLDPRAYTWQHAHWHGRPWEETVLYELHVGALGGYAGVMQRLPALAQLGVTALELMPLNDFSGQRNWGYDGVLPYAPDSAYGRPDELKALIDAAHGLGLMMILDVVYNHFGPDGNYLPHYAQPFFRAGEPTPWGAAIDFERMEVRDFFCDNALYWLNEYRFDGLRFDAVQAIDNDDWLSELSRHLHASVEHGRHIHLILENERKTLSLLQQDFDAQWNDDAHHALHVLLTGETGGNYRAFAEQPVQHLAQVLSAGFAFPGEVASTRGEWGEPVERGERGERGEPDEPNTLSEPRLPDASSSQPNLSSADLPPSAFVMYLQNHDQIGNRAFGERLPSLCAPEALRAATALMLLSPHIPLLFMDEEHGSTQPFLFFTDYPEALAQAVRNGRRQEFARFSPDSPIDARTPLPDPNDPHTFTASCPPPDETALPPTEAHTRQTWRHFYQSALAVRAKLIAPRLTEARALGVQVLGDPTQSKALLARWQLCDGATLSLALNLDSQAIPFPHTPPGKVIFETPARARDQLNAQTLAGHTCLAWLTGDVNTYACGHDTRLIHPREWHE